MFGTRGSRAGAGPREFGFELETDGGGPARIAFRGRLAFADCYRCWGAVVALAEGAERDLDLDLTDVDGLDGGSAALLVDLRARLRELGRSAELIGAHGAVEGLLALYGAHPRRPSAKPDPRRRSALDQIGSVAAGLGSQAADVLDFLGGFVAEVGAAVRRPRRIRWRDVPVLLERHGPDGVPIVLLVNLLVGLILGYQAALQLEKYGAAIFVADLVGLSVVRELGPLMTAIIVAGRSGAAFAAEIGTMKVSEEIDALRTIGLGPYGFLVWPRALAMLVALPVLTLLGDALGILGGLLVGIGPLGLSPVAYWNRTVEAIGWDDVWSGLLKSVAFAFVVTLIACERGLRTDGGAQGVGRSTTSAVVSTILCLIVLDAVFAVLFNVWGI